MERVVSLIPSTTEITCALGFRDALVGRSHECDYPDGIAALPVLTEPKLNPGAPSLDIDDRVKQLVGEGLSVYRVDVDLLRELSPTLILTQDQCEVCAASLRDVEVALAEWTGTRPQVLSLDPKTLGDVWDDLLRVASALGAAETGRALATELADRVSQVVEQTQRLRDKPRVACVEWIEPLMGAGNWIPEIVTLAGGRPAFGETGAHSPWLEWEALIAADPDVIFLMPCGFDIERTRCELAPLSERSGWSELRAVREERVYLGDGNQYFNRPGPRLVDSLEILAEILHPDHFPAKHRGSGWQSL